MLIVQSASAPTRIRNALVDLIDQGTQELKVASAYVTLGASRILLDHVRAVVGEKAFNAMPKSLATSFDFGLTEPDALRHWRALPGSQVHVAGEAALLRGSLQPQRAYHPKLYVFSQGNGGKSGVLVGSANLTARGLSVNTEAAWLEKAASRTQTDAAFIEAMQGTTLLTDALLRRYEELRVRTPAPREIRQEAEPVAQPRQVDAQQLPEFRQQIESGAIDLTQYSAMWVQGEGMQGGSQNQLELPRDGHRFFGATFTNYANQNKETIAKPVLRHASTVWNDRLLTWHGNNRMERLNLPTRNHGGFDYVGKAVLFRRMPDGSFELVVEPWESDLARAWRQASADKHVLFRLGKTGNRLVGLL